MPAEPRIIIVGAGVAGIAAGVSLVEKGFKNVTILEAEDRVGGRVHTVPFGVSHVDMGAHWVHGVEGNVAFKIGNDSGLIESSNDFEETECLTDDGREIDPDIYAKLYDYSDNLLHDNEQLIKANTSIENYLMNRLVPLAKTKISDQKLLNAFVEWLLKFECTIEGCDTLNDTSSAGLAHYKTCPGDPLLRWKSGGYKNIVDLLLNVHPVSAGKVNPLEGKIVLNAEVTEIDWGGLTGIVRCKDGRTFNADHVIVTTSLGVLKDRHSTLFKPRLPAKKIEAITGLGIGTVNKIYLKFGKQWWPEDVNGFNLLRTNKSAPLETGEFPWERDLIGFYTESSSPLVLGGWLVGEAARDMETCTDQQVLAGCYRVLKKFIGRKYAVPPPEAVIRSKWYSNPHFRGSYSYRSVSTEVLGTSADALAEPVKNFYNKEILYFAGEATHNHFYSTVHGALETGRREADRLGKIYEKVGKCSL